MIHHNGNVPHDHPGLLSGRGVPHVHKGGIVHQTRKAVKVELYQFPHHEWRWEGIDVWEIEDS